MAWQPLRRSSSEVWTTSLLARSGPRPFGLGLDHATLPAHTHLLVSVG